MRIYTILGWIAMLAMPAAASLNFGWQAYDTLLLRTQTIPLAVAGGVFTGLGMELLGVLAGHLSVTLYGRRDGRWLTAAVAMLAYVAVGTVELWGVPMARFIPFLAAVVYVLVGLNYEVETAVVDERQDEREEKDFKRRLRWQKTKMRHEEKMAQIQAKAARTSPVTSGQFPGDFRLLSDEQKQQIVGMTTGELVETADISDSTARRWKRKVTENGHVK